MQAGIVSDRRDAAHPTAWRISLSDGQRKHDATVETEDGTTPSRRNYRFNVAAYHLDKVLELDLVPPSVVRTVNGRPASVTWWVDNVAMAEQDRREKKIEPPDAERWNKQMAAVRVFDELISNPYRNIGPPPALSTSDEGPPPSHVWGELLITRDWRMALIDHTGAFRARRQLEHPESLTRCDRALLGKLRKLTKEVFQQTLTKYLSPEQLDALEFRRALLVTYFDEQIARKGEGAVLYDLPPRR